MKIEIIEGYGARVTPETDFEALFWSNIKKEKQELEAKTNSLEKNVKILAEDNSYLRHKLDKAKVKY